MRNTEAYVTTDDEDVETAAEASHIWTVLVVQPRVHAGAAENPQ